MNETFGSTGGNQTFGSTNVAAAPRMIEVSCLDVYSHETRTFQVPEGLSINAFFKDHLNISSDPKNFNIRVNHTDALSGQGLQPGDRILVTPTKIEGGRS